jgi:hypothetical protein
MIRSTHRLPASFGVLCALLGIVSQAWAQATPKPLSESLQGPARDAYGSAKILFNNNDFAGALAKYKQAYDESEDPRLLYDMAICEKSLRHYARMGRDLRDYERIEGAAITSEEKRIVDDALAAINDLVGTVRLDVNEAGSAVSVDGEAVGITPLAQALVLDLGPHKIVVAKDGFGPAEKELEVAGGRETALALVLVPQSHIARLLVSTDPQATVSIDGAVVGKGRFEGQQASGPHEISVTESGMRPFKAEVDLKEGERRTLQVTLESEHRAVLWPWILGGTALVAGAAVGGYFLLKPSDTVTPIPPGKFAAVTFTAWRQ